MNDTEAHTRTRTRTHRAEIGLFRLDLVGPLAGVWGPTSGRESEREMEPPNELGSAHLSRPGRVCVCVSAVGAFIARARFLFGLKT